jgi:hypothetical protein
MAAATAVPRHIEERGPALYRELHDRAARLSEAMSVATREVPFHVESTGSIVVVEPRLGDIPDATLSALSVALRFRRLTLGSRDE